MGICYTRQIIFFPCSIDSYASQIVSNLCISEFFDMKLEERAVTPKSASHLPSLPKQYSILALSNFLEPVEFSSAALYQWMEKREWMAVGWGWMEGCRVSHRPRSKSNILPVIILSGATVSNRARSVGNVEALKSEQSSRGLDGASSAKE